MINVEQTNIEGLVVITPKIFEDCRGYFFEAYNYNDFLKHELKYTFVQDNQSQSKKNVLRGLHFQCKKPQTKLIRVLDGEILDVVVDLRKMSKTYCQSFCVKLSSKNGKMLLIPKGFAHGFLVLSDSATILYKCDDFYDPTDEGGICWDDANLNIAWPGDRSKFILSEKDTKLPSLAEALLKIEW